MKILNLCRIIALIFIFNFCVNVVLAQEDPDQQLTDFNFVGYDDKGQKTWQVDGSSADIFNDNVEIDDFTGHIYGQDNIELKADKGNLNRETGKMKLQDNVEALTDSGAKLTTDSLDYDQKNELITTKDSVSLERENLTATGLGAKASPTLNKVYLEKEVQVEITPEEKEKKNKTRKVDKLSITCDGPLEVNYDDNEAIFNNNVKVSNAQGQMYCDRMHIFFSLSDEEVKDENVEQVDGGMFGSTSGKIQKVIAKGNVKIVRGENVTFSEEAIYTASDKKIVLTGRPKLFIFTQGEESAPFGN